MKIHYYPRFQESYHGLARNIQERAEKRVQIFRENSFHPILRTHKLHGKLQKFWSFSVDSRYRILFEFDGSDVIFLDIGDHELYR